MELIFRQIRAEGGCISYVVADARTRKAVIIDPVLDELETYADFLSRNQLTPVIALDTHTHADHYSATHDIARKFNIAVAMSGKTASKRASVKLVDGKHVEIGGDLALEVIETPGHTPDSVSLLVKTKLGNMVFTGDTLLIGGSGRTDFPGSNPANQYDSIYKKLGSLPETTWMMPGHDYSDLLFSTLGKEKASNPHYQFRTREEFVAMKEKEVLESAPLLQKIIDFNLNASPTNPFSAGSHTACSSGVEVQECKTCVVSEYVPLVTGGKSGALFIDVREPEEYVQGHIKNTRNIPMSQLFLHWGELSKASTIYLSCQRGGRSMFAANTLQRLGLKNVVSVNGGYLAWIGAGLPVQK